MKKAVYALDINMLVRSKPTGIARFTGELLKSLESSTRAEEFVVVVRRGADKSKIPDLKRIKVITFGIGNEFIWQQTFFPLYCALHDLTPISLANVQTIWNTGIVVIHDITYKTHAEAYRNFKGILSKWYHRFFYWHAAHFAKLVLTDSEFSKQEFARVYGYPLDRIQVLFLGWEHIQEVVEDDGVFDKFSTVRKGEYYFVLGNLFEYKNVAFAIRTAIAHPDTQFVITGTAMSTSAYSTEAHSNVVWTGYLSSGEVKSLLKSAKALFFPSLSEGFGLPPLESLALGVPAIVSRASCMPGVYHNYVHWIEDPIAKDPPHPDTYLALPVEPPVALLKEYSWSKLGHRFLEVLDVRKVAVFVPRPLGTGGVGVCMRNYMRQLEHSQIRMDFFVNEECPGWVKQEITSYGGNVYQTPRFGNPLGFIFVVRRILRLGHYDVVHANLNTLSILPLFAAWLARVPRRISHSHSASHPREHFRHLIKLALIPFAKWFATDLLACSRTAGSFQFGKCAMEGGRVKMLKNAIDLERYHFNMIDRNAVRTEFCLKNHLVIGCIGRFVTQKNPLFAIKVFAELAKLRPDAVLLMIGDGPLRSELEHAIAEAGLLGRVLLVGQRADPWRYYNAFDVFLLPSIYEGLGMVIIEAQTNGLECVVSTEVPREADVTGKVRFVGLDEPIEQWVRALLNGVTSEDARQERSISMSASVAAAGYDIKRSVSQLSSIYLASASLV